MINEVVRVDGRTAGADDQWRGLERTGWVAGINHGGHDAACVLTHWGETVVWVEHERLSRCKHALEQSPAASLVACLDHAGISLADLDCIALGSDHVRLAAWLGLQGSEIDRILPYEDLDRLLPEALFGDRRVPPRVLAVTHHLAHAASAYYPSGFDEAAALTLDAMGEDSSALLARCRHGTIEPLKSYGVDHSLGFFYEAAARFAGFNKNEAGKFMGLASYGVSKMPIPLTGANAGAGTLWTLSANGAAGREGIDQREKLLVDFFATHCFPFTEGLSEEIMAYKDFAASVQASLLGAVEAMAKLALKSAGSDHLVMAGGVALNCSMNGSLSGLEEVRRLFVQPAANDSGTALGAALVAARLLSPDRFQPTVMRHAYWGLPTRDAEVARVLKCRGVPYRKLDDGSLCREVAKLLAGGAVVAWHQGRAEIGPRALGARSLLGDPRYRANLVRINRIKGREIWRPLAPSVLEEAFGEFFTGTPNPFMLMAAKVKEEKQAIIPAVVHVDGTARPQVVSRSNNAIYAALITAFARETGVPVLINTSLNLRGQPICGSPDDSVDFFVASGVDALAIGSYLVERPIPSAHP